MPKVLASLLTLAALVTAVAQAPGVWFGHGGQPQTASADAAADAQPAVDQGAWLDTALSDAQMQVASWHHTWTDTDSTPDSFYAAPGASGRPAHYQPQGVLLAYEPGASEGGSSSYNAFGPNLNLRGGAHGSRPSTKPTSTSSSIDESSGEPLPTVDDEETTPGETGPDGTTDESGTAGPDDNSNEQPTPRDDVLVSLPGPTDDHTGEVPNPSTEEQPTRVPEPMTTGLLALGLAGMHVFGRNRSKRVA